MISEQNKEKTKKNKWYITQIRPKIFSPVQSGGALW